MQSPLIATTKGKDCLCCTTASVFDAVHLIQNNASPWHLAYNSASVYAVKPKQSRHDDVAEFDAVSLGQENTSPEHLLQGLLELMQHAMKFRSICKNCTANNSLVCRATPFVAVTLQ